MRALNPEAQSPVARFSLILHFAFGPSQEPALPVFSTSSFECSLRSASCDSVKNIVHVGFACAWQCTEKWLCQPWQSYMLTQPDSFSHQTQSVQNKPRPEQGSTRHVTLNCALAVVCTGCSPLIRTSRTSPYSLSEVYFQNCLYINQEFVSCPYVHS